MEEISIKDRLLLAKYKARQETARAIKAGLIERMPCRRCGAGRAEAHHIDYSRPLDIVWLCKDDHVLLHHWILTGRISNHGGLTNLQENILYYLEMDSDMLDLKQLAEDCGALNLESAALAIAMLTVKGYLKPTTGHEVDIADIKEFFKGVDNSQEIVDKYAYK